MARGRLRHRYDPSSDQFLGIPGVGATGVFLGRQERMGFGGCGGHDALLAGGSRPHSIMVSPSAAVRESEPRDMGSSMMNAAPCPSRDFTTIRPPCSRM